jgi:hypothetical protein
MTIYLTSKRALTKVPDAHLTDFMMQFNTFGWEYRDEMRSDADFSKADFDKVYEAVIELFYAANMQETNRFDITVDVNARDPGHSYTYNINKFNKNSKAHLAKAKIVAERITAELNKEFADQED